MVIVCPECSTKFRVNPERIPDAGAKVRCARCKHVFLAQKPAATEEPEAFSPAVETAAEPTPATAEPVAEAAAPAVEQEPEPEVAEQPEETPAATEEGSFSYDQFRELDETKTDDEDFTFGAEEDLATPDTDFSSEDISDTEEDEPFSFGSDDEDEIAEETPDLEPETAEEERPPTAAKELTHEEKLASIFDHGDEDEAEEDVEAELPPPAASQRQSSPSSSIIRVLLLLILGLVIIGGALYYINGPEQIQQAIQQILGQQSRPAEAGRITLTNLEGKFITNQEAGELFVIRGEATNNFNEPRKAIQVKGVIFDQNGNPLLQKTIFCGNPINDQELQTLPFSKLEERMRNQFGKSLDNMKVNSKESIPFVIAFRDLTKTLSEFSVDVTSSEPAN
jgi:predicted Zn finger-like uncharacterized protein